MSNFFTHFILSQNNSFNKKKEFIKINNGNKHLIFILAQSFIFIINFIISFVVNIYIFKYFKNQI